MAYEDGAIYALLDSLSLEARDVNRYILEAELDDSTAESSASASIVGETSQTLEEAILSPTNYVEVDITLGDAWVLNPRIGALSRLLEPSSLDSNVDTIANYLSIILARATLASAGISSGDILVATLDDVELSSLATAMGGSLQSTLGELNLLSALVGTMSAELSSTLADGTLSGVGALEQSGETDSQLEGLSAFSSEADIALEGALASTLSNVTKSLASDVVVDAEVSASFGDLTSVGNGFTATSFSPYQQIVTWSGHPASGQSVKTRLGNLTGITGNAGEFGLWAGEGWTGTLNEYDKYLVASNQGVEAHNIDIKLYDGTDLTIQLDQATPSFAMGDSLPVSFTSGIGLWMGKDGSDYKFRVGDPSANRLEWTGSLLSLYGAGLTLYSGASEAIVLDPSTPAFSVGNPAPSGFSTGSGLWTGITAEGYKFRLGDPSGARLEWESAYGADPSSLSLYSTSLRFEGATGHIALTQDATFNKVGSLFTGTGLWEDSTGIWGVYNGEVQVNIDATTGQLTVAGGSITLNSSGISMLGGVFSIGQASDFTTGTGVWIGELSSDTLVTYSDGQAMYTEGTVLGYQGTDEEALAIGGGWAFRIGDPTADRLEWDGISLNLYTPVINLVESATVGDPTIYFREVGESLLLTLSAQEDGTNTLATLAVTEFNSKPTKLALDASIITVSQHPASDYEVATKYYVDNNGGGTPDAGDVTYTPLVLADWDGSTDPGDVDNALDQLAERVTDNEGVLAGLSIPSDISELAYTPSVLTDWDGDVDPGNADDALDQLAQRIDDAELAIPSDASELTYTPAVSADWDGSTDPGDLDDAVDQLASRVADNEGAISSVSVPTDISELSYTPATAADWDSGTDPGDADDAIDQLGSRIKTAEGNLASNIASVYLSLPSIRGLWMGAQDPSGGVANLISGGYPMKYSNSPTGTGTEDGIACVGNTGSGWFERDANDNGYRLSGVESGVFSGDRGITIGCWAKLSAVNTGSNQALIAKWRPTSGYQSFMLYEESARLRLIIHDNGNSFSDNVYPTVGPLTANEWYFLVGRWSGTTYGNEMAVFIDDTKTTATPTADQIYDGSAYLSLLDTDNGDFNTQGYMTGAFICASWLSDAIIDSIWEATRATFGK